MRKFYTYLHCKPDLTPFYVGKGTGKRSHQFRRRSQYHKNIVAKYGRDNIVILVFPKDSEESAFKSEVRLIKILRGAGLELCNLTSGGEGPSGLKHTAEQNLDKSLKMRGKQSWCKGKKLTDKQLENRIGKKHSAEHNAKIGLAGIGNKRALGSHGRLGQKNTAEHTEKMAAAKRGIPNPHAGRAWTQASKDKLAATMARKKQLREVNA